MDDNATLLDIARNAYMTETRLAQERANELKDVVVLRLMQLYRAQESAQIVLMEIQNELDTLEQKAEKEYFSG